MAAPGNQGRLRLLSKGSVVTTWLGFWDMSAPSGLFTLTSDSPVFSGVGYNVS